MPEESVVSKPPTPSPRPTEQPISEPKPTQESATEAQSPNVIVEGSAPGESSAWPLLLFLVILAGVFVAVFAAVRRRHGKETPSERDGGSA
jgi:hypothetical protein